MNQTYLLFTRYLDLQGRIEVTTPSCYNYCQDEITWHFISGFFLKIKYAIPFGCLNY